MVLPGWGDILFGVALYALVLPHPWRSAPLFLLLMVLVAVIFTSVGVLAGALAFWVGQAQDLAMQLFNATLAFSLYPIDIFSGMVRVFLYTLLPAAFIGSVPARLLLEFDGQRLALLLAFAGGIALLARWAFYRGLRRYESGNLITARG